MSRISTDAIANSGARLLGTRWLVRAPILLYRARLGFVFGSRLLMLEHLGRASGATRYAVLEVVDHPAPDTYVVVSGFGARSQWYRNVQANHHVRISVAGHVRAAAAARTLTRTEAAATLNAYIGRHPRAWSNFKPIIEATLGSRIDDRDPAVPMIELRLRAAR